MATRAVSAVLSDCFTQHGLHRMEAAILLDNFTSQVVLQRTGSP